MVDVTVAIPFRASGSRMRRVNFEYLYGKMEEWFPEYELMVVDSGHKIFDRSATRNEAVRQASGDVVVLCDADTVPQPGVIEDAIVGADQDGRLHLPYTVFRGLTRTGTRQVLEKGADPHAIKPLETATWSIGGVWVTRKDSWWNAGGMDERFKGWAYEDNAYFAASNTLNGQTVRHEGFITHLFHPRAADLLVTPEYRFNKELYERYEAAEGNPEAMREVIGK